MAFDHFSIQALTYELQARLEGAVIQRVFTQDNTLCFASDNPEWVCGVGGRNGFLCLRDGPWPYASSLARGPEKYLVQARVVQVVAERTERILRLRLERKDSQDRSSYGILVCELIPAKIQFYLLREQGMEVLGKWGGTQERSQMGKSYKPPRAGGRLLPGEDAQSAWQALVSESELGLEKGARRWFAGADPDLVRELWYRAGLGEDGEGRGPESANVLWQAAAKAYGRGVENGEAYVWSDGDRMRYSALEPRRLKGECERFASISKAIQVVQERDKSQARQRSQHQKIRSQLVQALKKGRRRLQAMQLDLEEAAQIGEFEKKGNTLLANIAHLAGGRSIVELQDVFDPTGRALLRIELNPDRSPAENAVRYLKSVKKFKRRREILPGRIADLAQQCARYEDWIGEVEGDNWQHDQELRHWLENRGRPMDRARRAGPSAHPRRYRTSTGWSVWAGRNNKENDVLTHKMSAQNDLWFHAHGYPGSHVVLRREGRKEEPDKQTLQEAAALAAFWSKGKTAKKISVVYTLVKYVTKPRGGAPGQALLRREKAIVVEPFLLSEDNKGI